MVILLLAVVFVAFAVFLLVSGEEAFLTYFLLVSGALIACAGVVSLVSARRTRPDSAR